MTETDILIVLMMAPTTSNNIKTEHRENDGIHVFSTDILSVSQGEGVAIMIAVAELVTKSPRFLNSSCGKIIPSLTDTITCELFHSSRYSKTISLQNNRKTMLGI